MVRLFCLILFTMAALPLCAQTATVAGGGSSTTAAGFISVSIGQTADGYAADGNWYDGQGVQQPYCITRFDTLVADVCQHQSYTNGGFTIPADRTAAAGTFFFTQRLYTSEGCDSVVTLILTVHANTTGTDVQTACDSYTWIDGNTYTASSNNSPFRIYIIVIASSLSTSPSSIPPSRQPRHRPVNAINGVAAR